MRPTDLGAVVSSAVAIVEREFSSEGISVHTIPGEVPPLLADASQLGQVLMNLLINARHALLAREQKRITISHGADGGRAFIRVSDNGCGIAPENLPKLFLPFFSGKGEHAGNDPVQSLVRGSGLGLSISDTIVRNHGGEITVQSALGQGATFTVWVPITPAPAPEDEVDFGSDLTPIEGGRILVLDDELDVRELLQGVLARDGHSVVCSGDGEWALAELARRPVDVALVDLQMTPMSGLDFLSRLPAPGPATIVITGNPDPAAGREAQRRGADEVLVKPFAMSHLRRLVREVLASRRRRSSRGRGRRSRAGR